MDLKALRGHKGIYQKGKSIFWKEKGVEGGSKEDHGVSFHSIPTSPRSEERFVATFLKMGIKHNVVALIYGFAQKEGETVRDCANRLRQYIARCPEGEMPSPSRLVSIFLEGLLNKSLHANLYAKKHNILNACIRNSIDFDDNCDLYNNVDVSARSETTSTKNTIETGKNQPINAEAIAAMVIRKMNQVF